MAMSWAGFAEDFGDTTTAGCGAQWFDGTCESGWDSNGDDDVLDMCDVSGDYGVYVKPVDGTFTGITKEVSLASGTSSVAWTGEIWVMQDDSRVRLGIKFKNVNGGTVATSYDTDQLDEGWYRKRMVWTVPDTAVSAVVGIHAQTNGTEVYVDASGEHCPEFANRRQVLDCSEFP
jgi:hypothetical protein